MYTDVTSDFATGGASVTRSTFLTRKDISNRHAKVAQKCERLHDSDAQSVYMLVDKLKDTADNPVLYYKPQGKYP